MFGLFLLTTGTFIAFPAASFYECHKQGIDDPKACVEKVWDERDTAPLTGNYGNK